jgi:hypothetical protein
MALDANLIEGWFVHSSLLSPNTIFSCHPERRSLVCESAVSNSSIQRPLAKGLSL